MESQRRNCTQNMHRPFAGGFYDAQPQQQQNIIYPKPIPIQLNINEDPKFINPEPPFKLLKRNGTENDKEDNEITNSVNINTDKKINNDVADVNGDNKGYFKKIFGIRKKPSIRAKEKKIRQNRRLRKVLLPKNALMALYEVKNIKIEDFIINSYLSGGFTATVSVNNVQYEGAGNSKNAAKNNACEKALRDLVILKMNQKPLKPQKPSNENLMDIAESNIVGAGDGAAVVVEEEDIPMREADDADEDELPMLNLASFALYKLFSEWEADGFEVPEFRPSQSNGNNSDGCNANEKSKKVPSIRTDLPLNWETMHPATLLCMMRPGIIYIDGGLEGVPTNIIQKISVTIDDENFVGSGRSKKIARKNAAVLACNKLYGTEFPLYANS